MATPQELAAQIQAGQTPAPTTPVPAATTTPANVPVAPAPVSPEAPKTGATEGYINLGKGKVVNKNSAQYKALVAGGMTDEQIISKYQEKTAKPVATETPQNTQTAQPQATPAEPAKVEQPATVQPSVLPDFQDDTQARQDEIINNLNKYQQTNPGMMADRELFNKSFSYGARSDLQKSILDNWYTNNVEKATKTAGMTRQPSSDIASSYVSGNLSDSDLSNLQQTDPAKYAEVQGKIQEQQTAKKYAGLLYGEEAKAEEQSPADKMLAQINSMLSKTSSVDMYDEYKKSMNDPEVTGLMNDVTNKEGEIKQVDEQINASKSELEAQFKGSGMSQGRINAILQDQTQLLQNKRNTLNLEYQTAAQKYNNKLTVIKDTLEAQEKQYTMQMQQEQSMVQKMSFAYGIYSDQQKRQDTIKASDLQFKRDVQMMNEKYEKDFNQAVRVDKLQNGDINSADPYIVEKAIVKNVDQMMQQYDGLITSSRDQLVTRIKEGIKSGKSYGAVLSEITTDIQGKPEYRQWRNAKLGIDARPTSLGGGLLSIPDGKGGYSIVTEDQFKSMNNISSDQIQAITAQVQAERASSGQSQYDNYDIASACLAEVGKQGGQCGAFVNRILGERTFTNTIAEKIAATKAPNKYSPIPVVGGAVVIDNGASYVDGNGKTVNAGHVAIVTNVNSDGTFDYVDSNGKAGKEMVGINKGAKVDNRMYFTSAPGKSSPTAQKSSTVSPLSDDQRVVFNNQLGSFRGNAVVKQFEDSMTQYSNIKSSLDNPSGPGDIAAIYTFMKSLDPTSVVRDTEFNTAASSAGVSDKIGNTLQKLQNGKQLSADQRVAFAALAKSFVENRAKSYDRLYDDMVRVTDNSKIDRSYLPSRASDVMKSQSENNTNSSLSQPATIDYGRNSNMNNNSYAGYASTLYNK